MREPALERQVGGQHYKQMPIQPIEYIHANSLPFIEGCIVKYITRWRDKGGFGDLDKIIHYCELLKQLESHAEKTAVGVRDGDLVNSRLVGGVLRSNEGDKAYEAAKAAADRLRSDGAGHGAGAAVSAQPSGENDAMAKAQKNLY